ncbi:MAG: carboxypeptidase-like regulatory domain-containing protein [Terracidiphilus sp.]
MNGGKAGLAAAVFVAALAAGIAPFSTHGNPFAAQAQNLGQRNVSGAVVDADSAAVAGATVFLKNQKTKAIRSYTSAKDGRFHFAQVNMAEDYDLWAEKDGKKSPTKTVSSWDARKEFETELKFK